MNRYKKRTEVVSTGVFVYKWERITSQGLGTNKQNNTNEIIPSEKWTLKWEPLLCINEVGCLETIRM